MGSAVSNLCTYPLDLIITRLQIQRQLPKDPARAASDQYQSIPDAVRKIYETEGGVAGFYTGLLPDTGKTIADSFLFFLAYSFLRQRRIAARSAAGSEAVVIALPVLDELGIGLIAGSCTKLLTTPISNIVTRKQTAALTRAKSTLSPTETAERGSSRPRVPSTAEIAHDIMEEKGFTGFWSGYSAALVLSLNPSLTFFLFQTFKRLLLPRSRRENPLPSATFLLAAISKVCASSVTYPFSVAKARTQVSTPDASASSISTDTNQDEKPPTSSPTQTSRRVARSTIFSTLSNIIQSEGPAVLYSGLPLELLKSFLSHGTTMIVKQHAHGLVIQAYYMLGVLITRLRSDGLKAGAQTEKLLDRAREQRYEYYDLAQARAAERAAQASEKAAGIVGVVTAGLGGEGLLGRANETADLVADYVEDDSEEWRGLYGTGLARWFEEK